MFYINNQWLLVEQGFSYVTRSDLSRVDQTLKVNYVIIISSFSFYNLMGERGCFDILLSNHTKICTSNITYIDKYVDVCWLRLNEFD